MAIFAAFMLWPGFVFVVYRHARPGADRWNAADKLSVPTNILVAGIALFFMFRGDDLGAVTTSVTVADETGALVEREVPKQEFRKRIVLFEFDTDGLAEDERWRASVVADALNIEMLADDFFDPVRSDQVTERLRRSGYADQRNVPLALKRAILEGRGDTAGARAALERALSLWSRAEADFEPASEARRLLTSL